MVASETCDKHCRDREPIMTDATESDATAQQAPEEPKRPLSEAAKRALAEAEARRTAAATEQPDEIGGRGGLDPARYGDWEVKGIASDF